MKKTLLFVCFAVVFFICAVNKAQAQTSGNSPTIRVDPRLRGGWKILVAQIQDINLVTYYKPGFVMAEVGRTSVLPILGNNIISVENCEYTLDKNGSLSQIIKLDNGITWYVSPQLGQNNRPTNNFLLQVYRRVDNREIGRLLFNVVD